MSAAQRSVIRRLISHLFFALALALLIGAALHGQVLIPDPCKRAEPGSFEWYFFWCFLGSALSQLSQLFFGGTTTPTGFLVR